MAAVSRPAFPFNISIDCGLWFDGCNYCRVSQGKPVSCVLQNCSRTGTPHCVSNSSSGAAPTIPSSCSAWYTGCGACGVVNGQTVNCPSCSQASATPNCLLFQSCRVWWSGCRMCQRQSSSRASCLDDTCPQLGYWPATCLQQTTTHTAAGTQPQCAALVGQCGRCTECTSGQSTCSGNCAAFGEDPATGGGSSGGGNSGGGSSGGGNTEGGNSGGGNSGGGSSGGGLSVMFIPIIAVSVVLGLCLALSLCLLALRRQKRKAWQQRLSLDASPPGSFPDTPWAAGIDGIPLHDVGPSS
eukprot:EG_transcript_21288